jgi:hypothetical protein
MTEFEQVMERLGRAAKLPLDPHSRNARYHQAVIYSSDLRRLLSTLEEAREALEPFAKELTLTNEAIERFASTFPPDEKQARLPNTWAHYRRAAGLLSKMGGAK